MKIWNDSNADIELAERSLYSLGHTIIQLPPHRFCYYPAGRLASRSRHAGRPSFITIRVNGVEAQQITLSPDDFKKFTRLRFEVDCYGGLRIRGVEATFSDRLHLWGWRCFARSYVGRPELTVRSAEMY